MAEIAARQQGMITWAQLRSTGASRHSIAEHIGQGWLVPRYRSVYQFGAFAGPFGEEMAALLACGPRAVISHRSSAVVFVLCDRGRLVDVSVADGIPRRRSGIRPHRATALPPGDVVLRHGLRVTTPARTLLDLAASTSRAQLERLTEEAQVQNVVSTAELLAIVERGAGRPGVRKLRAIVDLLDEPLLTRSEAERRLVELCRSAALPMPRMNVKRAG